MIYRRDWKFLVFPQFMALPLFSVKPRSWFVQCFLCWDCGVDLMILLTCWLVFLDHGMVPERLWKEVPAFEVDKRILCSRFCHSFLVVFLMMVNTSFDCCSIHVFSCFVLSQRETSRFRTWSTWSKLVGLHVLQLQLWYLYLFVWWY